MKKLLAEDKPPQVLLDVIRERLGEDRPAIDAMIVVAAIRSLAGDAAFFKVLAEHGWGKPVTTVELGNKDDKPFETGVKFYMPDNGRDGKH